MGRFARFRILALGMAMFVLTLLAGCGGGGTSAATDASGAVAIPANAVAAAATPTPTTPLVAATIGAAGGKVEVTSGPLAGASVTIPPGALTSNVPITIQETSSVTVQGIEQWGSAVAFGPAGTTFAVPVTLTLPMKAVPVELTPASFVVLHRDDTNDVSVLLPESLNDGDTQIRVQTKSFSTFQPGVSGFRVTIVNNSGLPDDQVYVTQYGKNLAGSTFYYCLFDESPMQAFTNNASTPVGTRYSKKLTTLPFQNPATHTYSYVSPFDNMHSGRIYVSLKDGINIGMNSGNGFAEQSLTGQPGLYTPADFMELDCSVDGQGRKNIFVNTTNVDAFGLALSMSLTTTTKSYRFGFDHTKTRAEIIQAFQSMNAAFLNGGAFGCFVKDGSTVVRVLSPVQMLALNRNPATSALASYLDSAVNSGWTHYTGAPLTVSYQGFAYSGQVNGGNLEMTCTAVPDGNATTGKVGDKYIFPKPSTEIVFQGTDPKGDPGYNGGVDQASTRPWYNYTPDGGANASVYRKDAHNKLTALLTAAVIRGVFNDVAQWSQVASYYKTNPFNDFSAILHRFAEDGLCYGFGYDDIYEQAPALGTPLGDLGGVNGIVITIPTY